MKFVFTGFRDKDLEKLIVAYGGQVTTAVSKSTTMVITKSADDDSTKVKKAEDFGIKVITLEAFLEVLKKENHF